MRGVDLHRLRRNALANAGFNERGCPWLCGAGWRFRRHASAVDWRGALLDLAAIAGLLAVFGAAIEWRRRRRHRVWQFTLSELLLLTLLVAVVLGWWSAHVERRRFEAPFTGGTAYSPRICTTGYVGPAWLAKLAGRRRLEPLFAITTVYADRVWPGHELKRHLDDIAQFEYLRQLRVRELPLDTQAVEKIGRMRRLRRVVLVEAELTDGDPMVLGRWTHLDWLVLNNVVVQRRPADAAEPHRAENTGEAVRALGGEEVDALRHALPGCEIAWTAR
jgi:hypothetical protein